MINNGIVIGIDGYTGAGKSTIANKIIKKYKNVIHLEMSSLYKKIGEYYILLKNQGFTKREIVEFIKTYIKIEYKVADQKVIFNINLPQPVLNLSLFYIKNEFYEIVKIEEIQKIIYSQFRKTINALKKKNAVILTGRVLNEVYPKLDYHFCLKANEDIRIARIMSRDSVSDEEARIRIIEKNVYNISSNVISINSERLSSDDILELIENVIVTISKNVKLNNKKIIKVNFLGATSTGKSTMCRYCAEKYGEPYSTEYIRDFVDERNYGLKEQTHFSSELWCEIASTQLDLEKKREKLSKKYLFADSGAIALGLYWNLMENEEMLNLIDKQLQQADVIFVCDNNIDFEVDGKRPGNPLLSKKIQANILNLLNTKNIPYIILSGSIEERFKTVQQILNKIEKIK